jgi:hypothetical protein
MAWGSVKKCMLSGVISQFDFCGGTRSIQCQRQSDTLTRSLQRVCRGKGFKLFRHPQSSGVPILSRHGGDSNITCSFERKTHHEVPLSFQRSSVPDRLVKLVGMPQTDTSNMFQRKGGHVDTKKSSHVGFHDTHPLFWPWSFHSVHPVRYPKVLGDRIDVLSAVTSVLGLYWRVGIRRAQVRKH